MSTKTEGAILADAFESASQLTRYYLKKLYEQDWEQEFKQGEYTFPTLYWIAAHQCWANNFLCIVGTGGQSVNVPWLEEYRIGSQLADAKTKPAKDEIMETLKLIYETSINRLKSLDTATLDEQNPQQFHFGDGVDTKRMMVKHAIRHEGMHCGHISWLYRMYGL